MADTCLITHPVLCEIEWVLESVYGASRGDVVAAVRSLLATAPFVFEDRSLVEGALTAYARGKGDLSDHVVGGIAGSRGARTTYTFDRDLRPVDGFSLF